MSRFWNTNRWNRLRYTVWSAFYDRAVAIFQRWRGQSWALAAPQPGESILLLGAGTGLDLLFLPPECSITAIDLTPAMLERLKQRAAHRNMHVDARIMDGQALQLPPASFDVVALHLILAVIPDPIAAIREARRMLKPGGRIAIFDKFLPRGTRPGWAMRIFDAISSFLATDLTRSLEPMLEAAGLRAEVDKSMGPGGYYRVVRAVPQ